MANRPRFWAPDTHAERRPFLIARGEIARAVRELFAEREFVEVETATLQVSPGNETHIHAMRTELASSTGRDWRYLRTSPEFACKKLLAAGERRIFEFARCFRNRESGVLHHPEFTMLEWYRAHGQYEVLMDDCMAVTCAAAKTAGTRQFTFRDRTADPFAEPERVTVVEAFDRFAGIDLMAALPAEGPDRRRFAMMAIDAGVNIPNEEDSAGETPNEGTPDEETWGDIFSRVLVEKIEPHLGIGRATVLDEYPAVMSASGAAEGRRFAFGRTVRGLHLRRRDREWLRRADRSGRAAAAAGGRDGGKGAHLQRALSDRRRFHRRACDRCRRPAASRSASTGW